MGLLTNKYLKGIPEDSGVTSDYSYLNRKDITKEKLTKVARLNELANNREQTLAQLAITWVLRKPTITSALIGASKASQIEDIVCTLENPKLEKDELDTIDKITSS